MTEKTQLIPLDQIRPSPFNNRRNFDPAYITELAASIRVHGILQPPLVRPEAMTKHGINRSLFELIDGECRFRAAKEAGLTEITCRVRPMTDTEAREAIVIANEQRRDLSALEKAEGYAALVEKDGYTVDQIAAKTGKSESTIRGLLRLRNLPDKARKALEAGELAASVAELTASRPSPAMREKVAAYALEKKNRYGERDKNGELPSYRDVKEFIAEECMVELKQAPFNRKALDLVAGVPSCEVCPKRTGNNREEYPDARADICTDPACYQSKVKAWQSNIVAVAEAKGQKVLPQKEAEKLFPHQWNPGELGWNAPYFDLAKQCGEDTAKKKRSYKQLLEGHIQESDITLAFDQQGQLHRLVHKDIAIPVLKEHGLLKNSSSAKAQTSEEDRREKARRMAENKLAKETEKTIIQAASNSAQRIFQGMIGYGDRETTLLRHLALNAANSAWADRRDLVMSLHGCKGGKAFERMEQFEAIIQTSTGPQLLGILVELDASKYLLGWGEDKRRKDLAKALGLDLQKVKEETKKRLKEERAAKKAGKAKPSTNGKHAKSPPAEPHILDDVDGDLAEIEAIAEAQSRREVGE